MTAELMTEDLELNGDVDLADVGTEAQAVNEVPAALKLYFVRMPRPPTDDAKLKSLQAEFQAQIAEIKTINVRLAAKRDIVRELRGQLSQARSLKGSSQPEFEDKLNRLKQLRDLRNGYISSIKSIKDNVKGLECRSEAELDARIKELEDKIRFGGIPLREEKNVVNEISKLRSQREKIKDYEVQKSSLGELEAECAKVKGVIKEMEGEFDIIKGERDSASDAASSIFAKLKAAEKEAEKVEYEQKEVADKKNEALEALECLRREIDASMSEYRENRKFSLQIRDMVAVGQSDEARDLCSKQINEVMVKLSSDTAARSEYCQLWATQRRTPVSEVLPQSSTSSAASTAAKGPAGKGDKGGPAAAPAAKIAPRGKEKAASLIASIMQQASVEASRVKSGAPRPIHSDSDDEIEQVEPVQAPVKPSAPVKPVAPPKQVENPAAKAAEVFNFKVELPVVDDVEFIPPVIKETVEIVSKDQVREEQRIKAQEAEERKKRRAETTDKKRSRAVELQKKAEVEEREAKIKAEKEIHAQKHRVEPEPQEETDEEPAQPVSVQDKSLLLAKGAPAVGKLVLPAAKRPAGKGGLMKTLKKFYQTNQTVVAVAAVVVLLILIMILASLF